MKLALGVGQITLTNVDKTNRELVEHQILWGVHSVYGPETHYINLCLGLPISIYKAKKDAYTLIIGVINNNSIQVNLVDVKVMAEGHASIKPLAKYINKENTSLIIDVGMKTTDVLLIEHDGQKFIIRDYATVDIALFDIYQVLKDGISKRGVEVSVEYIDNRFKSTNKIIRTEQGDYDLVKHLHDAEHVCQDILKAIENKFGKIIIHDKIFTGGGAEKFLQAINNNIEHNVDIPTELRYYSNSLGYLLGL